MFSTDISRLLPYQSWTLFDVRFGFQSANLDSFFLLLQLHYCIFNRNSYVDIVVCPVALNKSLIIQDKIVWPLDARSCPPYTVLLLNHIEAVCLFFQLPFGERLFHFYPRDAPKTKRKRSLRRRQHLDKDRRVSLQAQCLVPIETGPVPVPGKQ